MRRIAPPRSRTSRALQRACGRSCARSSPIHLHAFAFLALCIPELAKFTRVTVLSETIGVVVLLAIPVYATLAFRRVYGGSPGATIAREVAIGAIYGAVSLVAFVLTISLISILG